MNPLWHHTPICMVSQTLNLWHHIHYIGYLPYSFHDNTKTIPVISPTIFDITTTVSVASHPLYQWHHHRYASHHTWHMYDIIHILHEITSAIYDINSQYLWHHNHYIWHHIHAISVITSTVLVISHQLNLWDLIQYIYGDIISIAYNNVFTIFVISQPVYLCITPTFFMISHPLCVWH